MRRSSALPAILTLIVALFASSCGNAWAAKKPKPVYQDGVLKDFHTEKDGTSCSTDGRTTGTVYAHTNEAGNTSGTVDANTTASTSCGQRIRAYYTVVIGDHTFVLTPIVNISMRKMFIPIVGLGLAMKDAARNCTLYGLLPGTHIQMVSKDSNIYIKVGDRESEYMIVSMR